MVTKPVLKPQTSGPRASPGLGQTRAQTSPRCCTQRPLSTPPQQPGRPRPLERRVLQRPGPAPSPHHGAPSSPLVGSRRLGSARSPGPAPPLARRTPGRPRQTYRAAGPSQREARPGTKRRHPAPPADPLVAAARPAPSARASQPLERFLRPHFRPALSQSLPLYREEAESRQR